MPGVVVERGDRVTFRTVEREDAEFRQRATTDPRVRYLLGMTRHRNASEAGGLVEAMDEGDDKLAYVVCLDSEDAPEGHPAGDGEAGEGGDDDQTDDEATTSTDDEATMPIGLVHAYETDSERAHLAYWLLPEYHGEGYGKEAASMLVDRVFENHPVHSVSAGAFAHNDASRGLLESLGFTQEYRNRECEYADGAYRDFVEYGLLRREWREQ